MRTRWFLCAGFGLAAVLVACGVFAGEYKTGAFAGGRAAVTNTQVNARWSLSGALVHFSTSPTGTVEIARVSGGTRFLIGTAPAGCTNVFWWAGQPVPTRYGDAVEVSAPGGAGTVQVLMDVSGR